MIESKDISVVVQGLTYKDSTKECLESIRKYLPDAEIILSTWEGSNVSDFDYDVLVLNHDPGAYKLILNQEKPLNNMNRQIVSTKGGLEKATRKYCLKFRTDFALVDNEFLKYFGKYKERNENWKILKERVLSNYATLPNFRVFHPTDIISFGLTEDIKKIWDIPIADKEHMNWFENHPLPEYVDGLPVMAKYGAEQYIWFTFLKNHENQFGQIDLKHTWDKSKENIYLSELSIVNNLLILDREQFNFKTLQHSYIFSDEVSSTFLKHDLWKYFYKKYCSNPKTFDFDYYVKYPLILKFQPLFLNKNYTELKRYFFKHLFKNPKKLVKTIKELFRSI